jgi:hypothetical protein
MPSEEFSFDPATWTSLSSHVEDALDTTNISYFDCAMEGQPGFYPIQDQPWSPPGLNGLGLVPVFGDDVPRSTASSSVFPGVSGTEPMESKSFNGAVLPVISWLEYEESPVLEDYWRRAHLQAASSAPTDANVPPQIPQHVTDSTSVYYSARSEGNSMFYSAASSIGDRYGMSRIRKSKRKR